MDFSNVYLSYEKRTGLKSATKRLLQGSLPSTIDEFNNEVKLLTSIDHPNVIKLFAPEFDARGNAFEYHMERVHFTLYDFAVNELHNVPTKTYYFRQLCDAISFIHKKNIFHRDIKLENVGVDSKNNVKLLDFGLAVQGTGPLVKGLVGTKLYKAPEIEDSKVTYRGDLCDAWSLGILCFGLYFGRFPWSVAHVSDVNFNLAYHFQAGGHGHGTILYCTRRLPNIRSKPSERIWKLMDGFLTMDPSKRLSVVNSQTMFT